MAKQPSAPASPIASLIDELGDLELELTPLKPKIARAEALKAAIRSFYKDSPSNGTYLTHGQRFSALIGAMGNVSVVNVARLFKRVGVKRFLEIATVTLKAITEKCGADVLGEVVSIEATGTRSLNVIAKVPEAQAQLKKAA